MSDSVPGPTGAPIKDASTVMLVRDTDPGVEVFLVRRAKSMAFAAGVTVFPGGGVDPSDADAQLDWAGPPPAWWGERLGLDAKRAQALVCAAVRETFEECGVLLAGPTADTVVADTTGYHEARGQLERRELSLSDFLTRENLVLRSDLLRPWARWVTPVIETRRYDTNFFVALLPEGQIPDGATTEAAEVMWRTPQAGIDDWQDGNTMLMPPTFTQLFSLAQFENTAAILAAEPTIETIAPTLDTSGPRWRLAFPGQENYYAVGELPDIRR